MEKAWNTLVFVSCGTGSGTKTTACVEFTIFPNFLHIATLSFFEKFVTYYCQLHKFSKNF